MEMKRDALKVIFTFALMTAVLSISGCGGKIHRTRLYVLNVATPVALDPPKPVLGSVAVREFIAPTFLKEGQIAYRPSSEQVEFYNYDRWAEDPRRMVTEIFAREVRARGIFQSVDMFDGQPSPEYLITGTLHNLEEVDQGSHVAIDVRVSARLLNLQTGEVLWQGASSKIGAVQERSTRRVVSELSRGVGSVVENLVSSMQARVSAVALSSGRSGVQLRPNGERTPENAGFSGAVIQK